MKKWALAGMAAAILCSSLGMEISAAPAETWSYTLRTAGQGEKPIRMILMAPLRETAEQLGLRVTWKQGEIQVDRGDAHVLVTPGKDSYTLVSDKAGQKTAAPVSLGVPPALVDNTAYVPVSFFRLFLGNAPEAIQVDGETLTLKTAEQKETAEKETPPGTQTEETGVKPVGMPNPFQDFDTLGEAEAAAGYAMTLPERAEETVNYRAISGTLLEAVYQKDGEETLRIRKGADQSDVSGDYNTYATIKTIRVDGVNVRMKGAGSRMQLATWERDGHAYAISAASPLTIEDMMQLVRAVR